MFNKIRRRMKGEKGFTLIELLVVIIIIAILAAIAIPTFLGQRSKAQDAAAKSLVRNAMTAMESAYVDTSTFVSTAMTPAIIMAIEPSITFTVGGTCTAAPAVTTTLLKDTGAKVNAVQYTGTIDSYSISTMSASGNVFGVFTSKTSAGTKFVKSIGGGAASVGW